MKNEKLLDRNKLQLDTKTTSKVFFITKIIFYWSIILFIIVLLSEVDTRYSLIELSIIVFAGLTLLLVIGSFIKGLFYLIPYMFKDLELKYIMRLKDQKGFANLTILEQQTFLDLMKTQYYNIVSKTIPIILIGVIITLTGFIIAILSIEIIGLAVILIAITYTVPFYYSKTKLLNIIHFEEEKIADYDKKYRLLIVEELEQKL